MVVTTDCMDIFISYNNHTIERQKGFSMTRYPPPPGLNIQWHESAESLHQALWGDIATETGSSYRQMMEDTVLMGADASGEEMEISYLQEIDGIKAMKCWGFIDMHAATIHAWAAPDADPAMILHMLAHEVGHATGSPDPDEVEEEMRAEQFGQVAKLAYAMLVQHSTVST